VRHLNPFESMKTALRVWLSLLNWPLALLILFEEWGWEPLQRLLARIGRWPGLRWIEARVQALPPYAALALLGVPALLLLPIKLLALWAIGQGHALLGVAVIVTAKLVGTALVARLFMLTHPALMQLAWFVRLYTGWSAWKARLLAQVRASAAWRAAREARATVQRHWARWTGRDAG